MFYDTLIKLCDKHNVKITPLLTSLGVSKSSSSSWEKGVSPNSDIIVKLSEYFNVSTDYLLLGKEPSIPTEYKKLISSYKMLSPENQKMALSLLNTMYDVQIENEKQSEIKLIDIKLMFNKVSAGKGYDLDDEDGEDIQIPDTPEARKAKFAVTVDGDSMETMFYDGDIVLIKEQKSIDIGQIGLFVVDNSKGFIKQLGEDRLISLNPECDDIMFADHETVECWGLVLGTTERIN